MLKISCIFFCAISLILGLIKQPLPNTSTLHADLNTPPIQEPIILPDISLPIDKVTYTIKPRATYSLQGLVVSSYDSSVWYDIYHKNDPGNIKDLCLVWGSNLENNTYRRVNFKSGQFTCYYSWFGDNLHFNPVDFSNNHLIPSTPAIRQAIKNTRRGDQVFIKGYLAHYTVSKQGETIFNRTTSLNRNDTGNGACEIIYVTDFKILKKPLIHVQDLQRISYLGIGFSIVGFIFSPFKTKDTSLH